MNATLPLPPAAAAAEASPARQLMDQAQTGLYVVQDDAIRYANPALAAMLGWPQGALVGQPHGVVLAPEHRAQAQASIQRRLAGKPGRPGEVRCLRRDGSSIDARVIARRIQFEGQPAVLVTLLDITELKDALRRAEWNAGMLAHTEALCRAGSFQLSGSEGRMRLSAGLLALLGLPAGHSADASLDSLPWVPEGERAFVAGIWRNAVVGEPFEFQHRVLCADGTRLVVLHRGLLHAPGQGVALLQDVTAQVAAAERIEVLATHHGLTGLRNRAGLIEQLDAALHTDSVPALLAAELPRFAEVKANMGFGGGDALSMALAARLREFAAAGEVVAQLADGEFALMTPVQPGAAARGALLERAAALQRVLQAPVRVGAADVHAPCMVGIAVAGQDGAGDSAERLIENAQTARLDIAGGAGVAFFRAESATRALRAMAIESALWRAIDAGELELHYQPQVDLASGSISGGEALLRWTSRELGPVSPGEFIPVAERSGLIAAIGDWVLAQAVAQLGRWARAGLPRVRVAVNLAPCQLQQADLAPRVARLLAEHGVDASWLGIELTESMLVADVARAAAVLSEVKALGVKISLDDFGTGFSSLAHLARLPIDVVKVDRSFVRDVTADVHDVSITRAIIHMTHGLQMRALAEGVETEGQLSLLAAAGCDEFQGWWFSKALPAAEFETLVRAGKCVSPTLLHRAGPRQRTLLLVDDDDTMLLMLERALQGEGYRVLRAQGADEALLRLAQHEVDVIVSDQRMPGLSGVEFLERAKALYPATVRLVLTGHADTDTVVDAVNRGAIYKFLLKPWDDAALRHQVAEAFAFQQQQH